MRNKEQMMFKSFTDGFKQGYYGAGKQPVADQPKAKSNFKFKKRYIVYAFFAVPLALGAVKGIVSEPETPAQIAARIAQEQAQELEREISFCKSKLESNIRWETKQRLRDPDSFKAGNVRWLPGKAKDSYEAVMTYHARNGFGGMNPGMTVASAIVSKETCTLKTINFPFS